MNDLLRRAIIAVDWEFFHEADRQRNASPELTYTGYFAAICEKGGVAPEPAELEARERACLKRFASPPPESMKAGMIRRFARDTWALDAALREVGLVATGPYSDPALKFFATTEARALFPLYVETEVIAG